MGNISVFIESIFISDYKINVTLTMYDDFNGVNVGSVDMRFNIYDERHYNNLMNLIAISAIQTICKVYFQSSDVRAYKRINDISRRLFDKFEIVSDREIFVDIKNKDST